MYPFIYNVDTKDYVCTLSCDEPFYLNEQLCKCEYNEEQECKLVCDEPLKLNEDFCFCECPLQFERCPEGFYLNKEFCECVKLAKD